MTSVNCWNEEAIKRGLAKLELTLSIKERPKRSLKLLLTSKLLRDKDHSQYLENLRLLNK